MMVNDRLVYDKAFEEMRAATVEDTVESIEDITRAVKYLQSLGIANVHTEDLAAGDFNVPLDAYLKTLGQDALKFRVNLLTHEQVYEDVRQIRNIKRTLLNAMQ